MKTKFKFYTKEQEEKIERLRMEAETEKEAKKNAPQPRSFDFEVGSPVFITLESKTISGYVMIKDGDLFEVKTPLGRIKNVKRSNLRNRFVEDLSGVEIPAELKEYSTGNLLNMMRIFRTGYSSYWGAPKFTESQVKAELRLRPHVTTKGERKIFKKYTN